MGSRVATCKMKLNGVLSVHSHGSRPCKSLTIKIYMAYLEKFKTSLVKLYDIGGNFHYRKPLDRFVWGIEKCIAVPHDVTMTDLARYWAAHYLPTPPPAFQHTWSSSLYSLTEAMFVCAAGAALKAPFKEFHFTEISSTKFPSNHYLRLFGTTQNSMVVNWDA